MREVTYTPTSVKGLKGSVVLKVPSFRERLALFSSSGVKITKDGIDMGENGASSLLLTLMNKLDEFVVSVDLKLGKHHFQSLDDLEYSSEGAEIINELIQVASNGISLGNA